MAYMKTYQYYTAQRCEKFEYSDTKFEFSYTKFEHSTDYKDGKIVDKAALKVEMVGEMVDKAIVSGENGRYYYVYGRQAGGHDRRHHYGILLCGDDSQALYAPTYRFRVH